MNLQQYKIKYGREAYVNLALLAGSTFMYFDQIIAGTRKPKISYGERVELASGGEVTAVEVLFPYVGREDNEIFKKTA